VANLIIAERDRAAGIHISLWTYGRAGIPLTLLTLANGAWWLSFSPPSPIGAITKKSGGA
jgi:Na+/H+ antiporter NhaD/arsenite permease-like protein